MRIENCMNPTILKPNSSLKNKTGTWKTYRAVFRREKCIGCETCKKVCPEGICYPNLKNKKNKSGKIYYANDLKYCKGCGLCAKMCPAKAIDMVLEEK